jgi:hypothetical protein
MWYTDLNTGRAMVIVMKKVLIFSDTHGNTDRCIKIIEESGHVDAVIHAGDYVRDAEDLTYIYPNLPIYYVKGNNDIFSNAPSHMTVIIDGVRIYITHGHEQRVKSDPTYLTLRSAAAAAKPNLIVFGHTHIPHTSYSGGVTILNPGSIRYSETYAVAEIDGGKLNTKILEID